MPRGGFRPNSGLPKGYKYKGTLDKDAAREYVRQRVIASLEPLLRAQLAHAQGIGHCFTRDRNGKFTKVEDPALIDELLTTGNEGEHYFIFTKDPSALAFKELLDRAIDRPKEQATEIHISGEIELSTRLTQARNRIIDVQILPKKTLASGEKEPSPQEK